jgi:hypothetical protein
MAFRKPLPPSFDKAQRLNEAMPSLTEDEKINQLINFDHPRVQLPYPTRMSSREMELVTFLAEKLHCSKNQVLRNGLYLYFEELFGRGKAEALNLHIDQKYLPK